MIKTLREFWQEVAEICYDTSDYGVIAQIRSQYRTNEINKFVNSFIPGTEILKDGKNVYQRAGVHEKQELIDLVEKFK